MYTLCYSDAINCCVDFLEELFKKGKRKVIIKDEEYLKIIRRKPLKKRLNKTYVSLIRINGVIYWIVEKDGICTLERSKYK